MARVWQIYLVRHGLAEARGSEWPDDRKRPLTGEGVKQVRRVGRGLSRLDVVPDVILTSPLVRARQTADVLANAFDPEPPVLEVESLVPDMPIAALYADLVKHARRSRIALVGHEPDLGELAGRLAGLRRRLAFRKGAVCRIDVNALPPDHAGALRWFVTPGILKRVG